MIKHKWIGAAVSVLIALSLLLLGLAYFNPEALSSFTAGFDEKYVSEMDKNEILSIRIIADEAEWADMLENATDEKYIPVTIVINDTKIENAGIRPKGNSSLSMVAQDDTTDRYSFKIEFDHYISGQTWLGLDKLVVNNMQGDSTYMKEYLSYDIMDYTGVSTPLYSFADISVNGESWGFYLAVEALEDSYAQRVFGSNHGELYKPESTGMQDMGGMKDFAEGEMPQWGEGEIPSQFQTGEMPQPQTGEMQQQPQMGDMPQQPQTGDFPDAQIEQKVEGTENGFAADRRGQGGFGGGMAGGFGGGMASDGVSLSYTDDDISSYSAIFDNSVFKTGDGDYNRVINALKKLSEGEDLESAVDVEAVLKYFAAHTVVVNLDSYVSSMGHNYYLYEENGQLTILPWDYNLAFGGFQSGNASEVINFPIDTPVSGVSLDDRPLLGKLLEVPEYLELYHSYLRQIADGYFSGGMFEEKLESLDAMISSYVENNPSAFYDYDEYKSGVSELLALGLLRAESISGQLDGSVPSTSEGQSAEPEKLVDSSEIDLSLLGSQGGGGGGFPGGDGNFPGGAPDFSQEGFTPPDQAQAANSGQLPDQTQAAGGGFAPPNQTQAADGGFAPQNQTQQQNTGPGRQSSSFSSGYDAYTWIVLGFSTLLLLGGLAFVFLFKRRRSA